jgi:hypothetical protein
MISKAAWTLTKIFLIHDDDEEEEDDDDDEDDDNDNGDVVVVVNDDDVILTLMKVKTAMIMLVYSVKCVTCTVRYSLPNCRNVYGT